MQKRTNKCNFEAYSNTKGRMFWKAFPMSNRGKFNSLYIIILYKSILSTMQCKSVIRASRAWCTLFLPICKCSHCRSSHSSQSDFKLPIEIRGLCQVSRELSRTFFLYISATRLAHLWYSHNNLELKHNIF